MMSPDTGNPLARASIRRAFDAAAARYDAAAVLQRHVADELIERLAERALDPRRVLDLGAGTGYLAARLRRLYPRAQVHALDLSPRMARASAVAVDGLAACGDAEAPPYPTGAFDLVVSSMTLQWCNCAPVFDAVAGLLRGDGEWLFSSVGPDTLWELRQSFAAVDDAPHVHDFIDMHHLGDALLAAGFRDPVLDVDRLNVTYESLRLLLADLKTLGAVNADARRSRGLFGAAAYRRLQAEYEKLRQPDGMLPSTWEVIYGQAREASSSVRVEFGGR